MTKTYMGVRLKTLREQQGLTQAALAASLKISPSYLNQIENDQRPLTVPVLLRLQAAHGIDLQLFSDDESARRLSELQPVFSDGSQAHAVPLAEAKVVASQLPSVARVLLNLHRRSRAVEEQLSSIVADGDRLAGDPAARLQPYEEVREFFYARHHHMAVLDELAEQLHETLMTGLPPGTVSAAELRSRLQDRLLKRHGIQVCIQERQDAANRASDQALRSYDAATGTMSLASDMDPGQQAFQLGVQLAFLEMGERIDAFTTAESFTTSQARSLARLGFANHFAGALVLPNRLFQDAAQALRYDIELLSARFGVGFETIGHRLSTMHHAPGCGIPFSSCGWTARATCPSGSPPPISTSRATAAPARCGTSTKPFRSPAPSSRSCRACPTAAPTCGSRAPSNTGAAVTARPGACSRWPSAATRATPIAWSTPRAST